MKRFVGCMVLLCTGIQVGWCVSVDTVTRQMVCPAPSALMLNPDDHTWFVKGGWQSFSTSLESRIDRFLGAQWQGSQVGTIFCLYQPADSLSFPVKLQYNRLVNEPSGQAWRKNQGGYRNCVSGNPNACPFVALGAAQTKPNADVLEIKKTNSTTEIGF
ncbi:MAG: hypothetical protein A3J38_10335 [Gammaproteobacteria bacterium RIFCSPHIGHO2_12_FULL_45_9]|nr:MAG: hypothetical protein A3J38_10335 [Gammaproteobacteria bacterium RIFCSPHIGHO2_12_FULL_45_9]